MRYVIYLRVSTDQQADSGQGLEIQEQACRAWLRAGRHRLAGVYTDAGLSGSLDIGDRPGLTAATAMLADDRADGMLVYRLDRLARELLLQETLLAEMHRRGKELHSCSPTEDANLVDDPDDPQRAFVRRMLGSVAQFERDLIRLRLRAGRARKALSGGYAGGAPSYGWAAVRGELVKVPGEQSAIRGMARMRDRGASYREIVAWLEGQGIRSRASHGKWRPDTVRGILLREKARKAPAENGVYHAPELAEVTG
jgi:DNA invertase Pin-like site-specific DNA recombinase